MEILDIKLENIRLHNRINKLNKKENEIKKNVYLNLEEYSNKVKEIQEENFKLRNENIKLKKELERISEDYNRIPKVFKFIFKKRS